MEDIIEKYKRKNIIKNIWVVITSLALALALNIYLSDTNFWQNIKWSVIDSSNDISIKSDLFLEKDPKAWENIIILKSAQNISWAKNISFSMVYDKDNVSIKSKLNQIPWSEIIDLKNIDWYNTIILNFKLPTDIKSGQEILKIVLDKKENKSENLNLISSNFTDKEDNIYMLSTSGIWF